MQAHRQSTGKQRSSIRCLNKVHSHCCAPRSQRQSCRVCANAVTRAWVAWLGHHRSGHALLQTGTPNQCVLAKVHMGSVREHLGICSGGQRALIAMALLLGGDYHVRGAENIGPKLVNASLHILSDRNLKLPNHRRVASRQNAG
jgi:hypothetical protein